MRALPTRTRAPRTALAGAAAVVAALLAVGLGLGPVADASAARSPAAQSPAAAARSVGPVGGDLLATPGIHVRAKPGATPTRLPGLPATSWLVADVTTGEVLAAKNAHRQLRPASTLKTLTAVTLLPRLDPNDTYTPVYADVTADGSKVGIVNGSRYTIDQLWYGLFLASGNDTAHALARANGGQARTVAEMNAEARHLQANDTVAKTPSGLDADGQHSSAYDLALISRAGLSMPDFSKYCGTVSTTFPGAGKRPNRKTFMVYNHNPLLLHPYAGAIGVKTGYTTKANRTFVGAATRGNRTIMITLMDYTAETYPVASALLDWGFKNASRVEPVGQLVDPLPDAATAADGGGAGARPRTTTAASAGPSHGKPWWPFMLIVLGVGAFAAWSVRGGIRFPESDPLAAANKGLGGRRGSSGRPRGRSGPRGY